jgi:hypothetical protein
MDEVKKLTTSDLTGIDAKIMFSLIEKQPQTTEELIGNAGVTKKTFKYRRLPVLKGLGIVKEVPGGWALKYYISLDEKVDKALEELRREGYIHVTLQDISHKTRLPPRTIEESTYLLAPDHDITIADKSLKIDMSIDETSLKQSR